MAARSGWLQMTHRREWREGFDLLRLSFVDFTASPSFTAGSGIGVLLFSFYGGVNPPLHLQLPLFLAFGAKKTTLVQNLHRAVLAERSLKPLA